MPPDPQMQPAVTTSETSKTIGSSLQIDNEMNQTSTEKINRASNNASFHMIKAPSDSFDHTFASATALPTVKEEASS